jgi:valyl-tRNA synthetase
MNEKFLQPYDAQKTEGAIYQKWSDSGYFNPDNLPKEHTEKYSIIMPPPNANGRLHAGHGTDMTLKDVMIRFQRMRGKKTLLLPGSDHAGFETQGVFEKKLQKEGRSRFGMQRDDLYSEIYQFVMDNKHVMEDDIKKLGISCDWSRNTFTLEPDVVDRVQDTFIKMNKEGLVYRGKRSIHWNPKFQTSLSDIETKFEDRIESFYYFKYGPFTIGTSRPETKFSDKYIVVHPEDPRYAQYKHMQEFEVEWINGPIKAILLKDEAANIEMGSGAMTITPWHSQVDFELAQKYNLPVEQIIDWEGKLLPISEEFAGMKIAAARPAIVEKLKGKGLLVSIDEKYKHAVRICERTGVVVEPQIKDQWFVKMDVLAKMTLNSLNAGEYRFLTERHERIFRHWMENPIDWNISRQIVWGIQIPAWIKKDTDGNEEIIVSKERPTTAGWEQDPDTFDTWFSSGQWPLVTLGYPDGADMEYYPTDVMETGADLVFKWVPRMIMFGLYLTGKVPFKDIYFHGMVLDAKGKKMSKSKGNVLSPVDLGAEFGTDATRMAFIVGNPPGADMPLSQDKVRAYKKFANKIWNVARFVLSETQETKSVSYTDSDQDILDEQMVLFKEITSEMEDYKFYLVAEKIYHYTWNRFASEILEESKQVLQYGTDAEKDSRKNLLLELFKNILRGIHPFMPFITEEIWQHIPKVQNERELLLIEPWPIK